MFISNCVKVIIGLSLFIISLTIIFVIIFVDIGNDEVVTNTYSSDKKPITSPTIVSKVDLPEGVVYKEIKYYNSNGELEHVEEFIESPQKKEEGKGNFGY